MGSPMVFHTAPPQPASKARMTCSPQLVGGPEASQKGLGLRMPMKSRGQVSHGAPPWLLRDARAGQRRRSPAPRACRPPPRPPPRGRRSRSRRRRSTAGCAVRPVGRSTTMEPPRTSMPPVSSQHVRPSRDWPSAGITMSHGKSKSEPGTALGVAAAARIRLARAASARTSPPRRVRPAPRSATGCASQWKRTPSSFACSYSKAKAGISFSVRR